MTRGEDDDGVGATSSSRDGLVGLEEIHDRRPRDPARRGTDRSWYAHFQLDFFDLWLDLVDLRLITRNFRFGDFWVFFGELWMGFVVSGGVRPCVDGDEG
ncbi:hypothetical protein Dimus_022163 [Dionaea muscipula]